MFDNMIVSDAKGAESKGRSRYFIVSSAIVGILFLTAVVLSIYAVDIGLGNDEFELSTMLAPVTPDAPEPPRQEQPRNQSQTRQSDVPTRVHNIPRVEEAPTAIPDTISVNKSPFQTRPLGRFRIDSTDSPGAGVPLEAGTSRGGGTSGSSLVDTKPEAVAETVKIPDPPPALKTKPPTMVSKGVVNGTATYLPHPLYPATAKMVGAQGAVSVQVTIDETGKVVSAKAVDGHPLLKPAAEKAAWNAKFSPTKLSDVPVKVTGMIVYNFKRS